MTSITCENLKTLQKDMEDLYEKRDDSSDEVDSTTTNGENINIILKTFGDSGLGKKRKIIDGDITYSLLAQRELDSEKIQKLLKRISYYKSQISRIETQLHYLRLDYNNALIKTEELEKSIVVLKTTSSSTPTLIYYMLFVSFCFNFILFVHNFL